MKTCVCTLNYGSKKSLLYKFFKEFFIPTLEDYAKRINSDLVILDKNDDIYFQTWNQLRFLELFNKYDRVLYMDGDIFIPQSFNVDFFDIVPYGSIGMIRNEIKKAQCKHSFMLLLLDKENLKYFSNFNVSIQEQKDWEILNKCVKCKYCKVKECFFFFLKVVVLI